MFEGLVNIVKGLILSSGPLGIFLGMFLGSSVIPISSEAALVAAGGVGFSPIDIAIYGGLGSTLGAIVGYCIGRYGGRPFLNRYGRYFFITSNKLKFMDRWFERFGDYSVLISRLIPIIPYKIFSIASGIGKMNLIHYIVFTLIGSVPRAFLLGYFGSLLMTAKNVLLMLIILGIFTLLPLVVTRVGKGRKEEKFE